MVIEQIGTGNSIAEAYEAAKNLLAAPEDAELHQEIIQDVKKKLFGLKTEPAKVKVWYEKPDPVKPASENKIPAEKRPQKQHEASEKKAAEKKIPEKKVPEKKEAANIQAEKEPASETLTQLAIEENDTAANFLNKVIKGMEIENAKLTLEKDEADEEYIYTIDCGQEDGVLIGRRGETLDAIQYLLRLTVNKGVDDNKHRKLSVNIGNYREKRNDNLKALAVKDAKQVLKYGRSIALEPMNPYERRIIHTTIQGIEGVTSHSVGADSNRKVIISLEEGVTPTNPSRGGYNRRDNYRGGSRQRNGKGGYQKKEPYKPSVTREPRKDNAGSLYGKIEVPAKPEDK